MNRIRVVGVPAAGISARELGVLAGCRLVVASPRFREAIGGLGADFVAITPLEEAFAAMETHLAHGDVGVLATGDPLFYGIGRRLRDRFGTARCCFLPAPTMVQELCARLGRPWDDCRVLSLHGRGDLERVAVNCLQGPTVAVYTDPRHTPATLARAMLHRLQGCGAAHHATDYRLHVGANLGAADERLSSGDPAVIAAFDHDGPATVLVERLPPAPPPVFGLTEDEIVHSRGLITKDEVRSAVLHWLRLPAEGVLWDVGAGSGSVGLAAALLFPGLLAYGVERNATELANIRANIERFRAYNLLPVAGEAPDVFSTIPRDPDRVFVGGSGGRLAAIVGGCAGRLRPGGRIVVTAVTEATRHQAPRLLAAQGLAVAGAQVAVARLDATGNWQPRNPITIYCGSRE